MTGSRHVRDVAVVAERKRLSMADKHAIVQQLRRLGVEGRPLAGHVASVARQHDVSAKSVYRWLKDPLFAGDEPPQRRARTGRFDVELEHLTVVADDQNRAKAYRKMRKAGLVTCSYSAFTRAMRERTDPTLVAAALDGWPGLVNNRLYLTWAPPHRNHTFHLDHTKLDLWVWRSQREREPVRPFVTVVVDGYSGLIHAVPWLDDVDGDMVAAALADATVTRDYFGVTVGGLPEQVILDNAAQHFGPSMRQAVLNLNWVLAPTAAYSSWQNGKAERAIGLINQHLSNQAPGATNAGKTRRNVSRHFSGNVKDLKPGDIWTATAFKQALQEVVDEINTTFQMKRHGGLTRLQMYAADPTEQRLMDASAVRMAMLSTDHNTHKANKNGLQFDGKYYVGKALQYGRRYVVHYLPHNRSFIEVFDAATGEYAGQCRRADSFSVEDRQEFLAARAEQEQQARAIEAGTQAYRRHKAAADNAGVLYGHENVDEVATVTPIPAGDGGDSPATRPEGVAADWLHPDGFLAEVTSIASGTAKKARSRKRPTLPRVPARPAPSTKVQSDRQKATDRLASMHAHVLPQNFQSTTTPEEKS